MRRNVYRKDVARMLGRGPSSPGRERRMGEGQREARAQESLESTRETERGGHGNLKDCCALPDFPRAQKKHEKGHEALEAPVPSVSLLDLLYSKPPQTDFRVHQRM